MITTGIKSYLVKPCCKAIFRFIAPGSGVDPEERFLRIKDGTPIFIYNYLGLDQTKVTGSSPLPSGKATLAMDFTYEGGRGGGGTVTLSIDDKQVGSGHVATTEPNIYSADETASVGIDMETPVSDDYTLGTSRFTGSIHKVKISLKE